MGHMNLEQMQRDSLKRRLVLFHVRLNDILEGSYADPEMWVGVWEAFHFMLKLAIFLFIF